MKKRILAILIVFSLFFLCTPAVWALDMDTSGYSSRFLSRNSFPTDNLREADILNYYGLFQGTGSGYELNREVTRMEALITVIRLTGKEEEALAKALPHTFSDVPEWADAYAGYGQEYSLIQGLGEGIMGAEDKVTPLQYATMILRVLGYNDGAGDFSYNNALKFILDAELINDWAYDYYKKQNKLLRNDIVYFMYQTLYGEGKNGGQPLVLSIALKDSQSRAKYCQTLISHGESQGEISRALANGYTELSLKEVNQVIDDGKLRDKYKTCFKGYMYNWLKEPGMLKAIPEIKNKLKKLKVEETSLADDSTMLKSDDYLAYFEYPSRMVIRNDLDAVRYNHALSHEFRHAMSNMLEESILEEGITEIWTQEVNGGGQGYVYYYLNISRILAHIIGPGALNGADLSGDAEDIFFALYKKTGIDVTKTELGKALLKLNDDTNLKADPSDVNYILLSLIKAYYDKNFQAILSKSDNYQAFIDDLLALGQLLYYPSAMMDKAESNTSLKSPSSYYKEGFTKWAAQMLAKYNQETGTEISVLQAYYEANQDTRYCRQYYGVDGGKMLVKDSTAYYIEYAYNGKSHQLLLGSKAYADELDEQLNLLINREIAKEGFRVKSY